MKKMLLFFSLGIVCIAQLANAQSKIIIRNESWGYFSNPPIASESVATGGWALTEGMVAIGRGGLDNFGVKGIAKGGTNYNVGVYGFADSAAVTGVGVHAKSFNAGSSNYGVYAEASGGIQAWAGYFVGNVFTTGVYQPSDLRLKRNIKTEESVIQKIMRLRPVSYQYKTDEMKYLQLPRENQHGFVAQELQEVFPEAVKSVQQPVFENDKVVRTEEFSAINYQVLLPLLFKAMQEQQTMIEALQKEVNDLKGRKITKASFMSDAVPNPANVSTTIKYSIPATSQKASIEIYDAAGKKILQYNNLGGNSQIVVNSSQLSAGTYVYTMFVGEKPIMSNKFLVGKG